MVSPILRLITIWDQRFAAVIMIAVEIHHMARYHVGCFRIDILGDCDAHFPIYKPTGMLNEVHRIKLKQSTERMVITPIPFKADVSAIVIKAAPHLLLALRLCLLGDLIPQR